MGGGWRLGLEMGSGGASGLQSFPPKDGQKIDDEKNKQGLMTTFKKFLMILGI